MARLWRSCGVAGGGVPRWSSRRLDEGEARAAGVRGAARRAPARRTMAATLGGRGASRPATAWAGAAREMAGRAGRWRASASAYL